MTPIYKNRGRANNKSFLLEIGGGGGHRRQSKKPNFAIIYHKLKDLGANVGDRKDFFRDYNRLLAKREVVFILDDLNSAFFINSKTAEVVKGEVIGILRFRFYLGEDDYFDLDFRTSYGNVTINDCGGGGGRD